MLYYIVASIIVIFPIIIFKKYLKNLDLTMFYFSNVCLILSVIFLEMNIYQPLNFYFYAGWILKGIVVCCCYLVIEDNFSKIKHMTTQKEKNTNFLWIFMFVLLFLLTFLSCCKG